MKAPAAMRNARLSTLMAGVFAKSSEVEAGLSLVTAPETSQTPPGTATWPSGMGRQ